MNKTPNIQVITQKSQVASH